MQRLAILTFVAIAAAAWMASQQQRLAAFQSEPQTSQSVESTANGNSTGEDAQNTQPDGETQTQSASPKPPPPPDPAIVAAAEKLLREARDRLYATRSIRAKFVERANFGTRRFAAEGTYVSGWTSDSLQFPTPLKLTYRVEIGDSVGELVEVCDGRILRTSKIITTTNDDGSVSKTEQWTRKDVTQINEARYAAGTPEAAVIQVELSLGGLPTLLTSLERTMQFDTIREQIWQGEPTTIIEGTWRPETIAKFSQQMGGATQALAQLLPDRVRVYFAKDTLFPTRILYRKLVSRDPQVYLPLMSIEFMDIELDSGVGADEFRYPPPKGVDEIDETALYLQMIEQLKNQAQQPRSGQPAARPAGGANPQQQPTP